MDLAREYTFDATPAEVFAMFTDPAYVERRLVATGSLKTAVDVAAEGPGVQIITHRSLPPEVPSSVRRFVGDTIDLDEVQHWGAAAGDGSRDGTIRVQITGAPVNLDAVISLRATGSGTRYSVTGSVHSSVPLFGRKIENATGPVVFSALDKEAEVSQDWLAERR